MYQMPVRAIKNILGKELQDFRNRFYNAYPSFIMSDVQKEILSIGYELLKVKLDACVTYEDLEEFISFAGYRMSLEEWINSL